MNKENMHPDGSQNPYHIYYDNYLDTDACTECTGLIYKAAEDRKEWDSYREVYDFTPRSSLPEDNPH